MFKLKSIEIEGMHNVLHKKYNLKDFNYLYGNNGAGKSTVLQAIQLALLGYIPGTAKRKGDIFAHSNSKDMKVILCVENDEGLDITIEREFHRSGDAITSYVNIEPEDFDIESMLGELSLPIFNFSEFLNMSANQQKDWFIKFLPTSDQTIKWDDLMKEEIRLLNIHDTDFVTNSISEVENIANNSQSVIEGIRNVNNHFKSLLSFKKGESARIQSTIQSLVYYDGFEEDKSLDELKSEYKDVQAEKEELVSILNPIIQNEQAALELEQFEDINGKITFASPEEEPEYIEYLNKSKQIVDAQQDAANRINELNINKAELLTELRQNQNVISGNGICPYTQAKCDSIISFIEDLKFKCNEINNTLSRIDEEVNNVNTQLTTLTQENLQCNKVMEDIRSRYNEYNRIRLKFNTSIPYQAASTSDDIRNEISKCTDKLNDIHERIVKLEANLKYEELSDKLMAEKCQVDEHISMISSWIKLTDMNGLQTLIMNKPFVQLEDEITKQLQLFFNRNDINMEFNLETKANSFSFGLSINNKYCEYNLLSSGEKCLFTIALFISLVKSSNAALPVILVDDLLDHVDDTKIQSLFDSLYNIQDVQLIMAGVQKCTHPNSNDFVIEVK